MLRIRSRERPEWKPFAESHGFGFHTMYGAPYWDETAYYQFSLQQIERDLEDVSQELHAMAMDFVADAVRDDRILHQLAIPEAYWGYLKSSWAKRDPALYARFDLAYDGHSPAKLYELNYDTPTSLYESAFFQWVWLEQMKQLGYLPDTADQFNSIQEQLEETFTSIQLPIPLYFASIKDNEEDKGTVDYLRDIALQARLPARYIALEDIGINSENQLVDLDDEPIRSLFKLYPWEDLLNDEFAQHLPSSGAIIVEPVWKMILSNKAALVYLWQRHKGHPNLLETHFDDGISSLEKGWVRKPYFSREGANVHIRTHAGEDIVAEGPYGGHFIRQQFHPAPCFDNNYAVIGSWMVNEKACGIGIREDASLITQDLSRFVPHIILD